MAYNGKVALVTGAGSGMGQLAARTFAQTGAAIAAVDVKQSGLAETVKGLREYSLFLKRMLPTTIG